MGEYKNENQVKYGKKLVNIRMKAGTNFKFFDGKKVGKYKNKNGVKFFMGKFMPALNRSI